MDKNVDYYEDEPRKSLAAELDKLNAEWQEITDRRKKWMDDHMGDFAKFKIGDEIFDMATGTRLGIISRLYRYWGEPSRDPQYDHAMNINYEYCTGNNCFDNTSRRPIMIGTAKELEAQRNWRAEAVNWSKYFERVEDGARGEGKGV